jgi:flagellar hook protein FlgE
MSFTQGLSGLNAASKDLEVIGNNVANVNTVGFKASQAQFADVFAASLGGAAGAGQVGIGAKLAAVAQQFTQGAIATTNNPLDMAVNGPGFFVVHGTNGTGYTRNGQFQVDKGGNIVTSTGLNLQGWPAVGGVVANSGPTTNLVISSASIPPSVTTAVALGLNLDSRTTPPANATFSALDPTSYNFSTSTTIYDSLGNARMDTMYFQYAAPANPTSTVLNPPQASVVITPAITGATSIAFTAPGPNLGQTITSAGFPAGTTVTSVDTAANTFTTSAAATGAVASPMTFAAADRQTTVASTAGLVVGELVNGGPNAITAIAADGKTFTTSAGQPALVAGATTFGPAANTVATGAGTNVVTVASVIGLSVGQPILATASNSFPAGTTITSINTTNNTFTTSANATVTLPPATAITFGTINGNAWNVYTTIADPAAAAGTYLYNPGTAMTTLTFNALSGKLTGPSGPPLGQVTIGAQPNPILPTLTKGLAYNFAGATQFGATSAVTKMTVDGYTTGQLVGYSAATNGNITGQYSNGQTQLLGQVALATFANNQGLQPLGNNEWAASTASGPALTGIPGAGLNGVLQTSSVENSNTDLTAELVNMITAQRDYQANSQTIKTQETVMQTLINMR